MATVTVLNKLTINSVESREVYKKMQEKGLINQDELYLVNGDEAGEDYLANPSGGTEGQLLTKTADGSEWQDAPTGLPDGGTEGQILTKTADGQEWADAAGGVFWAVYGKTTLAEIATAHNAGKLVCLTKGAAVYRLSMINTTTEIATFDSIQPGTEDPEMNNNGRGLARGIILNTLGWSNVIAQRFTPTLHASQHAANGIDPLSPSDIGAIASDSLPSTESVLKSDGAGGLVAATPETDYASPVFMRKVTLPVASWNSSTKQQSVTVTGILADTTKQCIYPAPVDTSYRRPLDVAASQRHAAVRKEQHMNNIRKALRYIYIYILTLWTAGWAYDRQPREVWERSEDRGRDNNRKQRNLLLCRPERKVSPRGCQQFERKGARNDCGQYVCGKYYQLRSIRGDLCRSNQFLTRPVLLESERRLTSKEVAA